MKHYGIWGFGAVGVSVARFLSQQGHKLSVYDVRTLSTEEIMFLAELGAHLYKPSEFEQFLAETELIIPSPGVDTSQATGRATFVQELDLFTPRWHKPLIAVTGSLGKTTLVTVLDKILTANASRVALGGNIGTPLLDLLEEQTEADYGLIELSSFQLEYARPFAPTLAVITNFYANHLDRHGSLDLYLRAKCKIVTGQRADQKALIPLQLAKQIRTISDRPCAYFSAKQPTEQQLKQLKENDVLYTLDGSTLLRMTFTDSNIHTTQIPLSVSHTQRGSALLPETWLTLLAIADMIGLLGSETFRVPKLSTLEHRLEYVGEIDGKIVYNDSKSTIFEATQAAVASLAPKKIHLLLGGQSKGVDRTKLLGQLKGSIASALCFGEEADILSESCKGYGLVSSSHKTLDEALTASLRAAQSQEVILLSPAGASFDLYKNYKERGTHFKSLVRELSN